ncbi:centromere protein M [Latimeria chalumnae]|uniref:Centromere protein M n=1 Tax=Latimeria chalumnae TaxID=7897 RepID=H2ZZ79_LATCH|nr:PREDICTED: centromere protein M [Latimeria chalumnae]|eukprot:XP_006011016.1 PREDICTED: centromere protein M [Latimeria chalumnae]
MSVLKPFDKLPELNTATVLLVGAEEHYLEKLAEIIAKETQPFKINVRTAKRLPLPTENDYIRPRIDLIVFIINLHNKQSLSVVESALAFVDVKFFLGKVCFLATGVGMVKYCSVEAYSVRKLAESCCCPVIYTELESRKERESTAQRLVRMLKISAGFVPGVSALFFSSLLKTSS